LLRVPPAAQAAIGAMLGARGCVSYDATALTYTVVVCPAGMTDTFAPVVNCANNLYGAETAAPKYAQIAS
jgi:hypothetical protein